LAGPSAFYAELVPVLLTGLILVGVIASLWKRRHTRELDFQIFLLTPKTAPKPALFLGFLVVGTLSIGFFYIVPVRFFHEVRNHHYLHNLRAENVASITVGSHGLNSPEEIAAIVRTLNQTEWFISSHGGWASSVDLRIHEKSGAQYYFPVALFVRQSGAIIRFSRPAGRLGISWSDGYAFSEDLPDVLRRVGAPLPLK
jgi:hypothetical protein